MQALVHSVCPTLQQATVHPCLYCRLLDTHGQVWISLLWGHCFFLLSPCVWSHTCTLLACEVYSSEEIAILLLMVCQQGEIKEELQRSVPFCQLEEKEGILYGKDDSTIQRCVLTRGVTMLKDRHTISLFSPTSGL